MATTASAQVAATRKTPKFVLPASLKGPAPAEVKFVLPPVFGPALIADGAGYFAAVDARFHTTISVNISPSGGSPEEAAFLGGSDQWMQIGLPSTTPGMVTGSTHQDQLAVFNDGLALGVPVIGAQQYKATKGTSVAAYGKPGVTWCDVTPVGTATTAIKLVAAHYHVDLAGHNLTSVGTGSAILPSFQSGRCAIAAGDPAVGVLTHTAYILFNSANPGPTISIAGEQTGVPVYTSHAFANAYPQLTQAIVDALLKALTVIQTNVHDTAFLYGLLPQVETSVVPYPNFAEDIRLEGAVYNPKYNDGTFVPQEITDSWVLNEAAGVTPLGSVMSPAANFANKYVIRAYKDLGLTRPVGGQNGPAVLPTKLGKPSLEMAKAYAELTGQPVPANDGPSPLGKV